MKSKNLPRQQQDQSGSKQPRKHSEENHQKNSRGGRGDLSSCSFEEINQNITLQVSKLSQGAKGKKQLQKLWVKKKS